MSGIKNYLMDMILYWRVRGYNNTEIQNITGISRITINKYVTWLKDNEYETNL